MVFRVQKNGFWGQYIQPLGKKKKEEELKSKLIQCEFRTSYGEKLTNDFPCWDFFRTEHLSCRKKINYWQEKRIKHLTLKKD